MTTTTDTISTYRVTLRHPALDGPLVMDLIATDMDAAISRARFSAFHLYRDGRLLIAGITAVRLHAGTCADAGHDRGQCDYPRPVSTDA